MSSTYDRRSFLTHSAAAVGGVAMAGTVVDTLIADVAGATAGVGVGTPKLNGSLSVGLSSDATNYHTFTGQTGKWDEAGYVVASAVYDWLFAVNGTGTGVSPGLALSATPSNSYKTWTLQLRQNVKFHDGSNFDASSVVANYQAAKADTTVGLAIGPIIKDCIQGANSHEVIYTTVFSYAQFPIFLASGQIGAMANPTMFGNPSATPNGTGPFKFVSWTIGNNSKWTRNTNYWRKDAAGRSLPYLSNLTFKVLVDPSARLSALKSGGINIGVFDDGVSQKAIAGGVTSGGKKVAFTNSLKGISEPSKNCVMINTTGKDWTGAAGTQKVVGTPTAFWNPGPITPVSDIRIRQACAYALNRANYLKSLDNGQGLIVDGIFRSTSPFYKNPGYPATSLTKAKAAVKSWSASNGGKKPSVHLQYVAGSSTAVKGFNFVAGALKLAGITVVGVPVIQGTLILNAIFKQYELTAWSQFGGIVPDINYVWWDSPGGNSGFVNFANQSDPQIQSNMLAAMGQPSQAAQKTYWQNVNKRFAIDIPYLWLDSTGSVWAAQSTVSNWGNNHGPTAVSVNSTNQTLTPANGSLPDWSATWA